MYYGGSDDKGSFQPSGKFLRELYNLGGGGFNLYTPRGYTRMFGENGYKMGTHAFNRGFYHSNARGWNGISKSGQFIKAFEIVPMMSMFSPLLIF